MEWHASVDYGSIVKRLLSVRADTSGKDDSPMCTGATAGAAPRPPAPGEAGHGPGAACIVGVPQRLLAERVLPFTVSMGR